MVKSFMGVQFSLWRIKILFIWNSRVIVKYKKIPDSLFEVNVIKLGQSDKNLYHFVLVGIDPVLVSEVKDLGVYFRCIYSLFYALLVSLTNIRIWDWFIKPPHHCYGCSPKWTQTRTWSLRKASYEFVPLVCDSSSCLRLNHLTSCN